MKVSGPSASSLFLNEKSFLSAAEYAHRNFLATPFSGGSSLYQMHAERAICQLKDGRILDLSGSLAANYMNINTGVVDVNKIKRDFNSDVVKIIHRPNHDLLHSLRQAAHISVIKQFLDRNASTQIYQKLEVKHLERLQLMMLFCVAGRKDETGFHDSQEAKEKFYLEYRKTSARAYFEYVEKHRPDLYAGEEKETLYHDAWMVELMGAPSIPPDEERDKSNYFMIEKMKKDNINFPSRLNPFPGVHLDIMNIAHSLDLLRVYPPFSHDAANSEKNISLLLSKSFFYLKDKKSDQGTSSLTVENMLSAIKDTIAILQFSRRLLDESGDKTKTKVEMNDQKTNTLLNSPELMELVKSIENSKDSTKIREVNEKISKLVGRSIFQSGSYHYTNNRFKYCHYFNNSIQETDRDFAKDVVSSVAMLNSVRRPNFYVTSPSVKVEHKVQSYLNTKPTTVPTIMFYKTFANQLAVKFPDEDSRNYFIGLIGGKRKFSSQDKFNPGKECPATILDSNSTLIFPGYIAVNGELAASFPDLDMRKKFIEILFNSEKYKNFCTTYVGKDALYFNKNISETNFLHVPLAETTIPFAKDKETALEYKFKQFLISNQSLKKGAWYPVGSGNWEIGRSTYSGNLALANSDYHIEIDAHQKICCFDKKKDYALLQLPLSSLLDSNIQKIIIEHNKENTPAKKKM